MTRNKNFKSMKPILVAIILMVTFVIGFAGVADASEHEVNVDDDSTTIVEYGQTGIVEDTSISADTGFVVVDEDGAVLTPNDLLTETTDGNVSTDPADDVFTILSESERLEVPTTAYYDLVEGSNLQDPRGEYQVRNAITGSLTVPNQQPGAAGGNDRIYVEEMSANVDYRLVVSRSGTELFNQSYDAGTKVEDADISLSGSNTVSDGDSIDIQLVSEDGKDVLNQETIDSSGSYTEGSEITTTFNIDTGAPSVTVSESATTISSYVYDWQLSERGSDNDGEFSDSNDRLVVTDAQSKSIGIDFYFGQTIVLGFSQGSLDSSASYKVQRITDDGEEEVTLDRAIDDNDVNVNEDMIRIPTEDIKPDDANSADYKLVEDGTKIYELQVQTHTMSIEDEDSKFVNLETSDDTSELNISSPSRLGFDALIESDQLESDGLREVIDDSRLSEYNIDPSDISIERDNDGEKTGQIRIEDIVTSDGNQTVPLDFSGRESGEYGFIINAADTNASTQAVYNVEFGPSGSASFDKSAYQQEIGDNVEMDVEMTETDQVTFIINDDKYAPPGEDSLKFTVEDENDTSSFTLVFDTYLADETGSADFDDIFRVEDGSFVSTPSDMPKIAGSMAKDVYDIQLNVSGNQVDQSVIDLTERNTTDVNTWVLPNTEVTGGVDIEDIEEFGTQKETVAVEDWLVYEIEASGVFSDKLINEDTHPSALVNYDKRSASQPTDISSDYENNRFYQIPELHLEIEGDRPAPNEAQPRLNVETAEKMEVQPSEDKIYLFYRSGNLNNYRMQESGFTVDELEDIQTDFDVKLNFTDDYKYGGEKLNMDDNEMNHTREADMTREFEMVERKVVPTMTKIVTDNPGIDTRYGLTAEQNSTVSGKTEIAPGTDVTVTVASDEGSNAIFEQPETSVDENGTVEAQFNLESTNIGRNMTVQFFPMDKPQPAVIVEPNQDPEIESFDIDTPTTVGEEITMNAVVNKTTPDTQYEWDFDDGNTSRLENPAKVYRQTGTYNVTLTVDNSPNEDALNLTDTQQVQVVVEEQVNTPPVVRETIAPESLNVGEEGNFGVVATDENTDSLEYSWDFDDGNTDVGITSSHSYSTEGTYNVVVTVTDEGGEETVQDVGQITVTDPGPEGPAEYNVSINLSDSESGDPVAGSVALNDADSGSTVEQGQANESGIAEFTVEEGTYNVQASAGGYEPQEVPGVPIDSDQDLQVQLTPDSGDQNGNSTDGGDNPDQPGFTFLFGAIALAIGGGVVYKRREGKSNFDGL